jgi:transposase
MRKFLESCAGIDVGKREVAVTVLTGSANEEPKEESRLFETTVPAREKLRAWLIEERCSSGVMESTGSYWLPVWNVIQDAVAVIIANPEHVKARRGEKTDIQDSRRLAERLRVGDVRGSFVPSQEVQQLRDLTRRRKRLLGNASSERNRVQKILERANVKIANVVGDVFGVSGQQILDALMNRQEMSPAQLADLAKGRLRAKREKLAETLEGRRLNDHDRWMLQQSIDHMVFLEQQTSELEKRILGKLQPLQREYELLQTIPGVKQDTAAVILAETGETWRSFLQRRISPVGRESVQAITGVRAGKKTATSGMATNG